MLVRWLERTAACGLILGVGSFACAQDMLPVASPGLSADARMPALTDSRDEAPATTPAIAPATTPATPLTTPQATLQVTPPTTPPGTSPAPPSSASPADATPTPSTGPPATPDRYHWLDRTHQELYDAVWHSSMKVDRWFGSDQDAQIYQHGAYGSIAPALLWDQYNHLRTQLRFNANFPLPQIDERFHAFVGRVNPEEYITERDEPSGAFQRQYGPASEDQTIFGLSFHEPPKQNGYFDAGAGVRLAFPMDPYIKGSYVFEHGTSENGLLSLRETVFWQHSDGLGATSRVDLERIFDLRWLVRWTASGTVAQETRGTRGYAAILAMRGFPNRHAIAVEIGFDGESNAPVPLHDYGMKVAYRQSILRRWLIMEVRTSVDWPRDFRDQHRDRSLGIGIGFEMLFGTEDFLARPVTF